MSSQLPVTLRRALGRALLATAVGVLAVAGPASARTPVDPGTLNPAPPDFFNAECYAGAGGTVCTLYFSDDPIVDEPSGIVCGGTELLYSQDRSVVGKRYYDADGNLVQRHFREDMSGNLTNPDTGASLPWEQHDTILHNTSVPGVVDSGTIKTSGLIFRAWLPGGGSILLDAGTIVEDSATGDLIREGGEHAIRDLYVNGDTAGIQPLCDALD